MKYYWYLSLCLLLFACGKNGAQKDAEAVCDCFHKAWPSGTVEEKRKCLELQRQSGQKYLSNPEDIKAFNEVLTPCLLETMSKP